jgi:hypothetical protein
MAVRTTVDIPEHLHQILRERARRSNVSMRSLIIQALEQTYREKKKGRYVTGPLITGPFKRGPLYPKDENPHDLVFS